jgi:hypothetical protein
MSRLKLVGLVSSGTVWTALFVGGVLGLASTSLSANTSATKAPALGSVGASCHESGPKNCITSILDAMGGRKNLESINVLRLEIVSHTQVAEQSYRQEPFLTSDAHTTAILDLKGKRVYRKVEVTWPESDPGAPTISQVVIAGPDGGVRRGAKADQPCSPSDIEATRDALALLPVSVLLDAADATDLHFEAPAMLRSTLHLVLGFTSRGQPKRILINSFNLSLDAIDTTTQFHDFWFYWGDVDRRIYFDNWKFFHGFRFPTNTVEERNHLPWRSNQILNLDVNGQLDESLFQMDAGAKQQSLLAKGLEVPFKLGETKDLAPGVTLLVGPWNATIIKQDDGVLILECPLSSEYVSGVINEVKRRYPGTPIKAVLSTSDSWPHVGGIRQIVAEGIPVYALDLNLPLLDRLVHAPHSQSPDLLAQHPKLPKWQTVGQTINIGQGQNRLQLYPLRGASTERQYMVYFPEHKLLYASDTLSIHDDGSLYDPELMYEVVQAVQREHLGLLTVYAMHQGPTPWSQVESLVQTVASPR